MIFFYVLVIVHFNKEYHIQYSLSLTWVCVVRVYKFQAHQRGGNTGIAPSTPWWITRLLIFSKLHNASIQPLISRLIPSSCAWMCIILHPQIHTACQQLRVKYTNVQRSCNMKWWGACRSSKWLTHSCLCNKSCKSTVQKKKSLQRLLCAVLPKLWRASWKMLYDFNFTC